VPGGKAIIIVGRRSTGGHPLLLDRFTIDRLSMHGLGLVRSDERALQNKRGPRRINRFARSADVSMRTSGVTETIANEVIVVMTKQMQVDLA